MKAQMSAEQILDVAEKAIIDAAEVMNSKNRSISIMQRTGMFAVALAFTQLLNTAGRTAFVKYTNEFDSFNRGIDSITVDGRVIYKCEEVELS
jgi:hypothetical protein